MAIHGSELFQKAAEYKKCISYEASVCGAIPVIATIRDSLIGNRIESIFGIVNGTTNYILTKMSNENADYANVLADAQSKGYAESDPTKDVEGIDSAHKLAILAKLAYGLNFDFNSIYSEGVSNIKLEDIKYAQSLGYTLKLLAISKNLDNGLDLRVHPTLLPTNHPLASVNDVYNAAFLTGDAIGEMMLYGQGAGSLPTASAVVADVVDVAYGKAKSSFDNFTFMRDNPQKAKVLDILEIETRYYLHFLVKDTPNVLAKISGIIGNNNISIASVIQQEEVEDQGVPLVMLTHKAKEGDLVNAMEEIKQLDVVEGETRFIRIEDW